MQKTKFGEIVLDEQDLCDLIMQGRDLTAMSHATVDPRISLENLISSIQDPGSLVTWTFPDHSDRSVPEFDHGCQSHWFMPDQYRQMDIAQYVLDRCEAQEQLQRAGQELLLFQDHDLLDLLRYLKYLVDVMRDNQVIWGVGRGSSVASYVLYVIGVHRVDSLHYDLDIHEFLR